jgi:hypothetical protein
MRLQNIDFFEYGQTQEFATSKSSSATHWEELQQEEKIINKNENYDEKEKNGWLL